MADRTTTVRVNVLTDASGGISGLSKFGRLAGAAALGVGGLVLGGALATKKLYEFGDAADDADASIAQGLKTMKLFGKATDDVTKRVQEQGVQLSKNTAVDQVTIKNTQAKLLTFKELAKTADQTGGSFDRATQAAVDLAAKGFGTAETNAVQLGKALNDPVKGLTSLSRAGITFTDQEKERIKTLVESNKLGEAQALVLKNIESQVGGTAAATAGGFELMQNRVKLFGQELAERALPYIDRFGTFMIEKGFPAMQRFGNVLSENVLPKLRQFGGFIQERVVPVLAALVGFIGDHVVPMYRTILSGALAGAKDAFSRVAAAVERNRPQLEAMGDKLERIGTFLVDKVLPQLGKVYRVALPALGTAIALSIDNLALMYTAFSNVWDIVKKVADAIQSVIDKLGKIPGAGALGDVVGLVTRTASGVTGVADVPFSHTPAQVVNNIITVQGAVDPVSTSRQIEALLRRRGVRLGAAAS